MATRTVRPKLLYVIRGSYRPPVGTRFVKIGPWTWRVHRIFASERKARDQVVALNGDTAPQVGQSLSL